MYLHLPLRRSAVESIIINNSQVLRRNRSNAWSATIVGGYTTYNPTMYLLVRASYDYVLQQYHPYGLRAIRRAGKATCAPLFNVRSPPRPSHSTAAAVKSHDNSSTFHYITTSVPPQLAVSSSPNTHANTPVHELPTRVALQGEGDHHPNADLLLGIALHPRDLLRVEVRGEVLV